MALTTTNDTTITPGPAALNSLDIARDESLGDIKRITPAVSFPENYNKVKALDFNDDSDSHKSPFLNLTPNQDADTKVYANTSTYYQPKDINSRYKNFILGADNEAVNAELQTGWNMVGHAADNLVEKVGAYATQTAGFIGGAVGAATGGTINLINEGLGGDGKVVNKGNAISYMTDNFLTNLGDAWKENVQERSPIYKPKAYTEGNIWQKLGTKEWWLDDAIDRVALTGAMLLPGMAEAKGLGLFGAAIDEAGVLKATGLGAKAIETLAENPGLYNKIGRALGSNIYGEAAGGAADINAATALKFKGLIQGAQKVELYTWNVVGQSGLNGREAQVGIRKALNEQRDAGLNTLSDEQIEDKAAEGAAKGFWYTMPLSLVGSLVELPQIFSTAKTSESLLKKFFDKETGQMVEGALEQTARPSIGKLVLKTLGTGLEHGQNESAQVAVGRYLEESIAGKTKDQRVTLDEQNPFIAIAKNWIDNVNDPNGQNNIALGTIQGMLMSVGGHAKSVYKGEYAKTDTRNRNFINTLNQAKARRRFFTTPEDFYEKDANGKVEIHEDGNPKFNQDRLAEAGMSLIDAQDQREQWIDAVHSQDYSKLEDLKFNSLASISQNFFDDSKGMQYLNNLLRFEAKNQSESLDRINDSVNGVEETPQVQLQRNLDTVDKLKRAYDAIDQRHAGFTALEIDSKNKEEVSARNNYIRDFQNAQYYNAADQIHTQNKLDKNNHELLTLGSVNELIKDPSSPQEERVNALIVENKGLEDDLQSFKNEYKVLVDKKQFRAGFEQYKAGNKTTLDLVNDIQRNADIRETSISVPQPDLTTPGQTVAKDFNIGQSYSLSHPIVNENGKLILSPKITPLSGLVGGMHQVVLPDGKTAYLTPEQLGSYSMSDINNDNPAFAKIMNTAIDSVLNRDEFADIDKPIIGADKLEYINSLDNKELIKAVEKEFDVQAKEFKEKLEQQEKAQQQLAKNKEQLTKEQIEIENNSGTVVINTDTSVTPNDEAGAIVDANIFFQSGTTESEDYADPKLSAQHIKNSREFLNNIDSLPNRGSMRAILVTPGQEALVGLTGLAKLSYGEYDMSNIQDPENGFIGQVFIVQEDGKSYFVDKAGLQIGEVGKQLSEEDLKRVIFQTMRTTKTTDSKGNPRFRGKQQELFEAYKKEYVKFRQDLISNQDQMPAPFEFNVSRGIPMENTDANGVKERNHVGGILIDKDKISSQENLIVIPTTESIYHNGQSIKFPNGTPVLQYGSTLQFLNNKKFNSKEASTIFQVVKAFATDTLAQSESGQPIRLNRDYSAYLQNVLYWRKGETKNTNQININTDTLTIQLGGKNYLMSEIESNEQEIIANLKEAYNAINNTTLTKNFNEPFLEYTLDKDGNLNEEQVEWKNYQTYLLSDKNPDGSARAIDSTPLTTSVAAPSAELPYSFKQKYATIESMGLSIPAPVVEVKTAPVEGAPTVEKIGEYTIGNDVPNTFMLTGDRPVSFTAAYDENGKVAVQIESNDTTKNLATDKLPDGRLKVDAIIIPELKKIAEEKGQEFDLTKTNEEYVFDYLGNTIASDLQNKKDVETSKTAIVEEIPTVVEEVSDIDIKVEEISKKLDDLTEQFIKNGKTQKEAESLALQSITEKEKQILRDSYAKDQSTKKEIPTGPDRFSGGPADLPGYRAVGADGKERMTDAELQLFKQWHAENIPNIPFEVMDNLITMNNGEKAWGVFEDGVAKFVRGGLRGTEYHEIFEGIYKGMLSTDEQQALLNEFKSKSGIFIDRESGKKIEYNKATDKQAKERISDDFSDFRIGKFPARSLGEVIRNFFSRIMNFFKSFVSKPSLKEDLFKAINTGKFKERTLNESVKNEAAEYRAVENLTEQQTREFVQDMTARAAGILYTEGQKGLLFSPDGITGNEMFTKIEAQYSREYYNNGFNKMELLGEKAWEQLKEKTRISIRTLGVNFNTDDRVSINDEEVNKNDYAPEPFSTDWKKNSTGAIKFSMATLLEVQATNQENTLSLTLPAPKVSSIIGFKLLNFSRAFATVLDKLSNTTSVSKMVDKLSTLATEDPNYVRLFKLVGGKFSEGKMSKSIPFNEFSNTDWRYFIQFTQTFTKQKPEALIQYKEGNEVYMAPANLYTAIKQTQNNWIENIKILATTPDSLITRVGNVYQVDTKSLKDLPTKFPQDQVAFLKEIGVDFSLEAYNKLKSIQQVSFEKAVSSLKAYLGTEKDIMSLSGKTLGINGQLSTLAELFNKVTNPNQESTYTGVEGQKMGAFAENNAPSLFENEFNEVDTLDELLEKRPELRDLYNNGSQVLKKGGLFFDDKGNRIKEMKVSYIQGTKLIDDNKGVATSKLSLGERFTQEINQNLDGNYYVLIPADGSTEWMMNLGNNIKLNEIENGKAWPKINKIFQGYLKDDIALALDADNRKQLKNVGDKAKELRFFKDILSEKALTAINKLIADNASMESFETYINENAEDINASIKEYIDSTVTDTRKVLSESKQILLNKDLSFSYKGLLDTFVKDEGLNKSQLSDKTVNDILTFANANYIISNIEYHKVIFGDPYQFAIKEDGSLDETKRIKSFLSPRRTTFDTTEFNTFLNQKLNKIGEINLKPGDPGYQQFKSYTNTVTFKDVRVAGSLSNINKAFSKTNEADAMSWLMDGTYREVKLKNGQWDENAEAWHQWQMAYTRQNLPSYTYTSNNLQRHDEALVKTKEPKHVIEVLKPIVSGNKYNKATMDLVLDKFSQMPVYYSMVKGTTMEKLYVKMFEAGIGYAIVESGRKVGAEELHSLYNQDGSFNDDVFNNNIQVPWKAYGIQVETATEGAKEQTRGSQLTKLSSMDLFNNGKTIGATPERQEAIRNEYNRNVKILNDLHQHGYNTLLRKLGVVDNANGFTLKNGKAVSDTLMYEMLRREVSDNTIDTLQLDENEQFRIPFEASPSYIEIRNILYSLIDKAIISPKMNGGAHVQVPATMFESALKGRSLAMQTEKGWESITKEKYATLSESDKKKVMLTDNTLKFYTKEDPYCEIMLPHWFKGKLGKHADKTDAELIEYLNNTEDGKTLLQGIGFRIPTQALSSVEAVRVKGFLPQYMGSTVVVPSEITTKAGSDFDIDKLNMYLKSTYLDAKGDVRLIKYMGSEEATKEHYGEMFDKGMFLSKEQAKQLEQELNIGKDAEYEDRLVKSMFGEIGVFSDEDIIDDFVKSLTEQGVKETVINEMYKKSLENEYYDSLEKLITLPENFDRLISPIDDAGLKKLSTKLDELRGYDETTIKNRILNRNYMTLLRNSFVTAKRWVGIAAVNITNLSLKQKSEVYIDTNKFAALSEQDRKFLGDGSIALKHNTVTINGIERVSLSGITVKDSTELISNRLSGYATSFVDVAKDDYITKIIQSDLAIGTFMFLENIGTGEQAAMFLNQPIISAYLKYLNSISAKSLFTQKNIGAIKDNFITTQAILKDTELDITNLEGNIKDYYTGDEFDAKQNANQLRILDEFLKYAKMAEFNFKFTQATNYDTTKLRSAETLSKKQWRTQAALDTNIISSVDNILNSTFIGPQSKFLDKSTEAMGAVLKLDQLEFKEITNTVLRSFGNNEYLANDKFEKIAVEIKAAFIDYVVQTNTRYSDRIKELLVDDKTSVVVRMEKAKRAYPSLQILNELQADTGERPDGAKTIKLKVKPDNATDKNMYTGMMRELRDTPETNQLYKDIVELSILQGTYASPLSIREIIPIEDYSAIVEPIISGLVVDKNIDNFTKGWYQRNNFRNIDVMPIVKNVKFFRSYDEPIRTIDGDIYQYNSPLFPKVEGLDIQSNDRKILLLSEKYNFMDLKHDYVKIPRVVDGIDMMNGKEVTSADYARRKAKGDYSLKDYFGYEKVKDEYGQPLIHYTTVKGEIIGHHVYKLINLYGDGDRATENYQYFKPSVIDNGTIKIDTEIPNADILNHYGASLAKEEVVSLPAEEVVTEPKQVAKESKNIEVVDRYSVADVQANPDKIYVFGDNVIEKGKGGQAIIRDEENAFGIPTKVLPDTTPNSYFSDNKYEANISQIDRAIEKIKNDGRPIVFPKDGLGTGLAKLKEKAPQTYTYLKQRLLEEFGFDNDKGSITEQVEPKFKVEGNEVVYTEDGSTAQEYNSPEEAKEGLKEWAQLEKPIVEKAKQKELFTFEKAMAQKSFRNKPLNFVDNIPTTKEVTVAMSNNKKTGVISIDQKAMIQKFEDKAWTTPSKQLDGSFATALPENEFKSAEEWFTFGLLHEVKHDTIFKEEGETTGYYEDRINQAALEDLRNNYNIEESINKVITDLGAPIASLDISQEEWNSLSEEEKEQIKKCN